ncbi:hypothetical protein RHOER0001_6478 [Rhodococcus erythropolis SK121]|nr:hypothetical protein RHOER0001_6478 [Rhodococcus erythropolis SK121]
MDGVDRALQQLFVGHGPQPIGLRRSKHVRSESSPGRDDRPSANGKGPNIDSGIRQNRTHRTLTSQETP